MTSYLDILELLARAATRINVRYSLDNHRSFRDTEDVLTPERVLALLAVVKAAKEMRYVSDRESERRAAPFDAALAELEQM
jgi:hypothetical protein